MSALIKKNSKNNVIGNNLGNNVKNEVKNQLFSTLFAIIAISESFSGFAKTGATNFENYCKLDYILFKICCKICIEHQNSL